MAKSTLPKISVPAAARKGIPHPRPQSALVAGLAGPLVAPTPGGISPTGGGVSAGMAGGGAVTAGPQDPMQELQAYLATLSPGERAAEEGGLQGFLAGKQVAPEWYSATGNFDNPSAGGPSKIYQLAQRIQAAQAQQPGAKGGGPFILHAPAHIVDDATGKPLLALAEVRPEAISRHGSALEVADHVRGTERYTKARKAGPGLSGGGIVGGVGWIQTGPGSTAAPSSGSGAYGYREDPGYQAADQQRITAQQGATNENAAYLTHQQGSLLQTQQENLGITAAANNVGDQQATAQAQAIQGASDSNYGAFGIAPPKDVYNPGGVAGAVTGPGSRNAISSQQDVVTRNAQQQQQARGDVGNIMQNRTAEASNQAQTASTNVEQAQLNYFKNRQAGPASSGGGGGSAPAAFDGNPDGAAAQAASDRGAAIGRARGDTGLNTTNVPVGAGTGMAVPGTAYGGTMGGAQYGSYGTAAQKAGPQTPQGVPGSPEYLASAQGIADRKVTTDPFTGQETYSGALNQKYGGPEGLKTAEQQATENRTLVKDPTSGQMVTKQALSTRTDNAGNVKDAQGVWHSKDGQNVLGQDGKWTNPITGTVQVDDRTWRSADGQAQYTVTDPKTGAGYWEGAPGTKMAGWTIGAKGVWTSPDGSHELNTNTGALTRAATSFEKANPNFIPGTRVAVNGGAQPPAAPAPEAAPAPQTAATAPNVGASDAPKVDWTHLLP